MAKSGVVSKVASTGSDRSAGTRKQLIGAAISVLKTRGFAGASARNIADQATTNQGLIFYHFGSVSNLLLAALDDVSETRMKAYGSVVEHAQSPGELVRVAGDIFRQDLDAGHMTVLAEMIAGSSSVPGLGDEVAKRIGPWFTFAERAVEGTLGLSPLGALVPLHDAAYGIVALYLGLEMLSHLSGDRDPALKVFGLAEQLIAVLGAIGPAASSKAPEP